MGCNITNHFHNTVLPYVHELSEVDEVDKAETLSAKIIWTFYHQRKAVNEFLDSGAGMGRMKYMRVMILGCADAIIVLPLNVAGALLSSFQQQLLFWPGWAKVHKHFYVIPRIRAKVLEASGAALIISIRWMEWQNVFLAVVFFLLFGLTDEARRRYGKLFQPIRKVFGRKKKADGEVSKIVFKSFDIPTILPASPMSMYVMRIAYTQHISCSFLFNIAIIPRLPTRGG